MSETPLVLRSSVIPRNPLMSDIFERRQPDFSRVVDDVM
jgi:hypothetical protein